MSKIGVGVGDDFPVDDGAPKNTSEPPRDDRAEFEEWKRRQYDQNEYELILSCLPVPSQPQYLFF